jgi:hypothetical protein
MFKRVDVTGNEKLEGFSYINKDGDEESVSLPVGPSNVITLLFTDGEDVYVYKEDIPKLIKALEAVYNYKD